MVDKKYRNGLQWQKQFRKEKQRKDTIKCVIAVILFILFITPFYLAFMLSYWNYLGFTPVL
jgi:type IV secretory pathway component VirB8